MNISQLKQNIKDAKTRLFSLKTKKAIEKQSKIVEDLKRELRFLLLNQAESFNEANKDKIFKAEVIHVTTNWIIVFIPELNAKALIDVCNHVDSASWYNETCCISYVKGEIVELKAMAEVQEQHLSLSCKVTKGGKFDLEKYEKLRKNKNLAFFRYDLNKNEVSGFFC